MVWPAIIGAIGSIGGALINKMGSGGSGEAWQQFNQNYQNQKEFAQNAILWRVQDAQRAGVHPLFALGASGASYSPTINVSPDNSSSGLGSGFAAAGQEISRAMYAQAGKDEREKAAAAAAVIQGKQVEKMDAEINLINAQAAKLNSSQVPPAFPSVNPAIGRTGLPEGQNAPVGGSLAPVTPQLASMFGGWENKLPEIGTHRPGQPHTQGGPAGPSVKWVQTGRGLLATPTKDLGAEDEFGAPIMARFLHENWLLNTAKPTLKEMQQAFPGAIGMKGSAGHWFPVYPSIDDSEIERSIHRPGWTPQYDVPRRRAWPRRID